MPRNAFLVSMDITSLYHNGLEQGPTVGHMEERTEREASRAEEQRVPFFLAPDRTRFSLCEPVDKLLHELEYPTLRRKDSLQSVTHANAIITNALL